MSEALDKILANTEDAMKKAISHLEAELVKVSAGKANPNMLDGIVVDYYGSPMPISQVGNISVLDARTLSIQPWEKNMLQPMEKAIMASNIGITPQNDGMNIRLFLPPLTEERRKELVKRANGEGEQSKVAVRSIRRDAIENIKKLQKDGLSEDAGKDAEKEIQNSTDKYISLIENTSHKKKRKLWLYRPVTVEGLLHFQADSSQACTMMLAAFINCSSEIVNGGAMRRQCGAKKNQSVSKPFARQLSIIFLLVSKLSNSTPIHKPAERTAFIAGWISICFNKVSFFLPAPYNFLLATL